MTKHDADKIAVYVGEAIGLMDSLAPAGDSIRAMVAQAEALLAQARATVPPLQLALEAQLNRLDVLLGVQPGTYAGRLADRVGPVIPCCPAIRTCLCPAVVPVPGESPAGMDHSGGAARSDECNRDPFDACSSPKPSPASWR